MTASEAVASLEAAVLEFKKRDINTLEVRAALHFSEPYIRPAWFVPCEPWVFLGLVEKSTKYKSDPSCRSRQRNDCGKTEEPRLYA